MPETESESPQSGLTAPHELLKTLVSFPSVTPQDAGCQALIAQCLSGAGFSAERLDQNQVSNIWLRHGTSAPLFAFVGHTDVVPPGDNAQWRSDPFELSERDGHLYGRGTADMKGNIAACVVACERFVKNNPEHNGSVAVLLTSDEEGDAEDGTRHAVEVLNQRKEIMDWCVVVEPSSAKTLGDTIRNGRRGSLTGRLKIIGRQGHIAYPEKARNAIHAALAALHEMTELHLDDGNDFFPPSSLQFFRINAYAGAVNIIPGGLEADFNIRFSTETNPEQIRADIEKILQRNQLEYSLEWKLNAQPFLTKPGHLIQTTQETLSEVMGKPAALSAGGGTSDARFIAPHCKEVIELGLVNETIHQTNEHIKKDDLETLTQIYLRLLEKLLT